VVTWGQDPQLRLIIEGQLRGLTPREIWERTAMTRMEVAPARRRLYRLVQRLKKQP
jgi:hypothetical protein